MAEILKKEKQPILQLIRKVFSGLMQLNNRQPVNREGCLFFCIFINGVVRAAPAPYAEDKNIFTASFFLLLYCWVFR
jgi:hypothetical protein